MFYTPRSMCVLNCYHAVAQVLLRSMIWHFCAFLPVLTPVKRMYHKTFTIRSLRRATMLITDSDSTKQDAHELVGIRNERIQTIYPCIDERFSCMRDEAKIRFFRQQQGLTEGFFLYLGDLGSHARILQHASMPMPWRGNTTSYRKSSFWQEEKAGSMILSSQRFANWGLRQKCFSQGM